MAMMTVVERTGFSPLYHTIKAHTPCTTEEGTIVGIDLGLRIEEKNFDTFSIHFKYSAGSGQYLTGLRINKEAKKVLQKYLRSLYSGPLVGQKAITYRNSKGIIVAFRVLSTMKLFVVGEFQKRTGMKGPQIHHLDIHRPGTLKELEKLSEEFGWDFLEKMSYL